MNILVTATPFCEDSQKSIKILKKHNLNFTIYNKDISSESKLIKLLKDKEIVVAGLERYSEKVLKESKKLKLISRVGIGLDNVDLKAARKYNISVTHTPDGPTMAVVEFTIGLIFSALRLIHTSYVNILNSKWKRNTGFRIENSVIGIIGVGRTGSRVANLLKNLGVKKILINDINYKYKKFKKNIFKASKQKIYKEADIISLHIPLTNKTSNLISYKEFKLFKKNSILINTSRGGIVNENALYSALKRKKLFSAAMDVFAREPYKGRLRTLRNCLLTPHNASMSKDCRIRMETEATEEAIRLISKKKFKNLAN
mgnify:CR=1 FL=1